MIESCFFLFSPCW